MAFALEEIEPAPANFGGLHFYLVEGFEAGDFLAAGFLATVGFLAAGLRVVDFFAADFAGRGVPVSSAVLSRKASVAVSASSFPRAVASARRA